MQNVDQFESGRNVRSKSPLSPTIDLGRFINKTCVRMMNTCRPDLALDGVQPGP